MAVVFSPEAEAIMHRGFANARKAHHLSMTVEHLVLEMLREKPVAKYLAGCGTDVGTLTALLTAKVASFRAAQIETVETQANAEFSRLIRRAIDEAAIEQRSVIVLHDLFLAVLDEPNSYTASLILQQTSDPAAFDALRRERARRAKRAG